MIAVGDTGTGQVDKTANTVALPVKQNVGQAIVTMRENQILCLWTLFEQFRIEIAGMFSSLLGIEVAFVNQPKLDAAACQLHCYQQTSVEWAVVNGNAMNHPQSLC